MRKGKVPATVASQSASESTSVPLLTNTVSSPTPASRASFASLSRELCENVLDLVGQFSLAELLKCGRINRPFETLVDAHPVWGKLGRKLHLPPPKPRARVYKTWKSLVMRKRGKFCERCCATKGISQLPLFTGGQAARVFVCPPCARGCRKDQLCARLKHFGLQLRNDSRLCESYIEEGEGNLDFVVDTMREMSWFFRCTDYERLRICYDDDDWDPDWGLEGDSDSGSEWNSDWGSEWDSDWCSTRYREPRCYIDSDEGKRLAILQWVDDLMKRCGDRLMSAKDFVNHVDPSVCPPESLHGRIRTLIAQKRKSSAMALLKQALDGQTHENWDSIPAIANNLAGVITTEAFREAKSSVFNR
ncbi:hypothetical protein HK104_006242 [Borealophlyctis nickersoniae]|nr:hypothetical protein HK104_006242 [Borealophlyctis nickersoniae]